METIGKTIVIIGGGTGGIVLANELRRKLAPRHRIIVIERTETHAFAPSFLWLMVGQRQRDAITRPLRRMLSRGVDLIIGEAREIDTSRRLVEIGSEAIAYDWLVLASGTEMQFDLADAETFFTLDGADRLCTKLREFRGGAVAVVVAATPYKCPGAPAEGAMLIRDFLRQKGVSARVDLYTPEPAPMAAAGPQLGEAVRGMLAARDVGYHANHVVLREHGGVITFDSREPVSADLVVTVPRHTPPAIVKTAGIANENGWAAVDSRTLASKDPSIFAIGDCASIPLPGRWKPDVPLLLPKAGVFAHAQALALAGRIEALVKGTANRPEFCGDGFCMLEAGEHVAGFAHGDFYATPAPSVHLRDIGRSWHAGKVLFEKWWLAEPGLWKDALAMLLRNGGRLAGVPVELSTEAATA